ncbi:MULTISPECIES: ribosomal protection-like ABC-F family protein [unclassified Mesotoga]|uniref:ribosomal protection-like ABC-F family protein n=1 Tax=unclassified Mesotoga TaxID=1184398 RepID=UPI000B333063|nr:MULTISPECIES: ATP-binding cassette domain-containing protein [unclassified Mesotoga]MDD3460847.1 ATP-binding cassette domain-containing protein [Mesotoga sp.]HAY98520.1 ABC transporter [Mesotoga sp.]
MLLTLSKVGHDYGQDFLFDEVSTSIDKRDKIILLGKNGSGKSTLMRIIAGELSPTEGEVFHSSNVKIGYQIQSRIPDEKMTLMEYYLQDKSNVPLDTEEFYSYDRRVRSILVGLEFYEEDWERHLETFSGGELTRISLGKLFLVDHDILLLDEPTNHLDLESTEWLVDFLKSYKGALLVVTHDRYLIRNVGNRFWELNGGSLWDFAGTYDKYQSDREIMVKSGLRTRENLSREIERLDAVAKRYRLWGQEKFIKQAVNKERQRDRLKDQLETIDLPDEEIRPTKFRLPQPDRTGYSVLKIEGLSFGFGSKKLFNGASAEVHRRDKIGLLGPNGSGKTTLLRIITENLEEYVGQITWGHNVRWGYLSQLTEDLNPSNDVISEIWQLMRGQPDYEVRKYIGRFGFPGDDVFKPVPSLSGGERTKLALAKLILSKPNVLVMDEPTNNLDIWSIESLEEVLKEYEGCIILVSHDREFVQNVCDHFLMIDGKKLKAVSSVEEYLRRNQRNIDSTGNEYARLTFQERRRLSNKKKSVLERLQQLEVEENELSRKLEMAQLKMGLFSTDYEKLQDLYTGIERIESRLLEILQEREMLDDELDRLSETLDETS